MNDNTIFPKEYLYSDFEYENELKKLLYSISNPENNGHYFEIVSDDDLNKSKFIFEFRKRIENNDCNVFFTSGNIYLKQFPWQPFRELFYNFFGLKKDENLREKLFKFSKNFKEDVAIQNVYISELFCKKDDNRKVNLNNQMIFDSFRVFFLYASKLKKSVLIFDDVDNFDEQSLSLLDYLARTLKSLNIFIIVTRKNRFQWIPKHIEAVKISLKNISEFNAFHIIKKIADGEPSKELFSYIYEEAKGSFYYLLILSNFLKDNDYLESKDNLVYLKDMVKNDGKFLSSIPDLILLRINNLNLEERETLSVASIFGNKVDFEYLNRIINRDNLDDNINKLVEIGFLYIESLNNRRIIHFTNCEIMDYAYQNIQSNNRKEIHRRIVEILSDIFKNNLSDIYEFMAYHCENGALYVDAVYFYFMTGIKYRNMYDYGNGYKYLSKALLIAKKIIKNNENVIYFHDEEIDSLNFQIEEQYFSYLVKFKLNISVIYYFIGQTLLLSDAKSEDCYLKSLSYARRYEDVQFILLNKIELFHKKLYIANDFLKDYLSDIYKLSKDFENHFFIIFSLIENFLILLVFDNQEEDKEILNNAFLAKKILDNPHVKIEDEARRILLVRWHFFYSLYKKKKSSYKESEIEEINEIIKEGEKYLFYDNEKMNYYYKVSQSSLDKTKYKAYYLQKSIDIAEKINDTLHCIYNYSGLGYMYLLEKEYDKSLEYSIKAIKLCEETDNKFELGMIYKNLGELHISRGDYKKALECLYDSISYKELFPSCKIIDNFANVIIPYSDVIFCCIKLRDYVTAREYFVKVNDILPNIGMFTSEIPIFIEFLHNYLNFEESHDDSYRFRVRDIYSKLITLNPKPAFVDWLSGMGE